MPNTDIARVLKEIDNAWDSFVSRMKQIQDRNEITFVPADRKAWLNPRCYEMKQISHRGNDRYFIFKLAFDRRKIRHRLRKSKVILFKQ